MGFKSHFGEKYEFCGFAFEYQKIRIFANIGIQTLVRASFIPKRDGK